MSAPQQSYTHGGEVSWRRFFLSRAKLKAVSRTSALLSGFAMVAMVEIQIESKPLSTTTTAAPSATAEDEDKAKDGAAAGNGNVPDALLVLYALCTTLLVTVHLIALMISTCILPNLEVVSAEVSPQAISESPHEKMRHCVETAWICSTGVGILLFMVEIALLAWVKFYMWSVWAAWASSAVVVPAAILFVVFSVIFYRRLLAHKHERHEADIRQLEVIAHDLNRHSRTQNSLRVNLL